MPPTLPGNLHTIVRVGDVAGVHEVDIAVEIVGAVEEERTSLGKEQREGVVDIQLRRIRFDLRKIWIQCGIEHHVLIDSPAHIHSGFGIGICIAPGIDCRIGARLHAC